MGRLAIVVKVSHAVVDGVGSIEAILPEILAPTPQDVVETSGSAASSSPAPLPSLASLLADSARELLDDQQVTGRVVSRLVPAVVSGVGRALGLSGSLRA
jgi:hypothetical protein